MPFSLGSLFPWLRKGTPLTTSADLYRLLTAGRQSVAGVSVNESTALAVAAVMTCVSLISRTLGSLPIRVYERLGDRSKRPADGHPIGRVLSQPNSWQTLTDFLQMMQAHVLLRGNAYAWMNWIGPEGARELVELIPLHPDLVSVDVADSMQAKPLRYTLTRKDGSRMPLPFDEVLHLRGLSTDGFLGRSTLHDARDVFGVAIATQEHAGTFWAGGGLPDILLKHPKVMGDKAKKNLEESWIESYGGSKDKRRVAVLEEGLEVEAITPNADDMQFLQTRQFQRSEIAGWFHVPPHMIGDTEKSTSWGTGIEQQQIAFLSFTLLPWLRAWERRLNRDLVLNPARFFLEFNVDGLLRADIASRYNAYWRGVHGGWLSPNDVRAFENMNPIDGGDIYLQPTNMAPLGWEPSKEKSA